MTYIVTGAAGFIGSNFVAKLNAEGINDIIVVDNLGSGEKWKNLRSRTFLDYIHKDKFLELLQRGKLGQKFSAIVHLGACSTTTERNVDYIYQNNVEYSKTLAAYALKKKIRFVYASSASTYGDGSLGFSDDLKLLPKLKPLHPYGWSKHLVDLWLLKQKAINKVAGVKFFNVYGPNEYHKEGQLSIVLASYEQIKTQGYVKLFKSADVRYGDGEYLRDFVYVKDCCDVLWWLVKTPKVNGIINLGTGFATTWNTMVRAVFDALGLEPRIEYVDMAENLRRQYQYFTQADMRTLGRLGYKGSFSAAPAAVHDYVLNYLEQPDKYL